jgi:hypothetical protein
MKYRPIIDYLKENPETPLEEIQNKWGVSKPYASALRKIARGEKSDSKIYQILLRQLEKEEEKEEKEEAQYRELLSCDLAPIIETRQEIQKLVATLDETNVLLNDCLKEKAHLRRKLILRTYLMGGILLGDIITEVLFYFLQ